MSDEEQRAYWRENNRYHRQKAKLLHKCAACGKDLQPLADGSYRMYCRECKDKNNAYRRAVAAKRKLKHQCKDCGVEITAINPKTMDYYVRCAKCQAKYREYRRKGKGVENG